MAKKVVATLKKGDTVKGIKCIKMVKSEKTGAYVFKTDVLPSEAEAKAYLAKK